MPFIHPVAAPCSGAPGEVCCAWHHMFVLLVMLCMFGTWTVTGLSEKSSSFEAVYEVEGMEIQDAARYEHRGVMIDVARNFHTTTEILKLIDILAMYKLNKLHLHLADDEGWRLQIPGLEELTEVSFSYTVDPDFL